MTTPAGGIEPDRRYPIDDLLDRLPSLSRAEALEAICQYAADVTACACMPLIEENARLKVSAIFDKKDDRKTIGKCNHWPGQNECEWCRGRASTATASLEPQSPLEHLTERSALQPEAPCEDLADARRLDWIQRQWQDGVHVEVCGKGDGTTWRAVVPAASVFVGPLTVTGSTLREAIDAAMKEGP